MSQDKKEPSGTRAKDAESTNFTIAANDNPRANENIQQAPFEKEKNTEEDSNMVGSEITDGEGG